MTIIIPGMGEITASPDALNTICVFAWRAAESYKRAADGNKRGGVMYCSRKADEIGNAIYGELEAVGFYTRRERRASNGS